MKHIALALAALAFLVGCESDEQVGPSVLAKHVMAEVYGVSPDEVAAYTMPILSRPEDKAVLAVLGKHVCQVTAIPAAAGVAARFDWVVSSMQCGQSECELGEAKRGADGKVTVCSTGPLWKPASLKFEASTVTVEPCSPATAPCAGVDWKKITESAESGKITLPDDSSRHHFGNKRARLIEPSKPVSHEDGSYSVAALVTYDDATQAQCKIVVIVDGNGSLMPKSTECTPLIKSN